MSATRNFAVLTSDAPAAAAISVEGNAASRPKNTTFIPRSSKISRSWSIRCLGRIRPARPGSSASASSAA